MCSWFRPATLGTNSDLVPVACFKLQMPLYPARCIPSAVLSPITSSKSPQRNVSWPIVASQSAMVMKQPIVRIQRMQNVNEQYHPVTPPADSESHDDETPEIVGWIRWW